MAKQQLNTDSKKTIKNSSMNISTFIELKGGIKDLDRTALQKVYKKSNKTGQQWMEELKKLTIISSIDEDFLNREIG